MTVEDGQRLIAKRYKTSIDENVILLENYLPIKKYYDIDRKGGRFSLYGERLQLSFLVENKRFAKFKFTADNNL